MFSDCHNTVAPRAGAAPPHPPPPTQAVLGKKTSFILVGSEMKEKNERSLGHWFHSALSYLRTWSSPMYSRMGLYLYQQSLSRLHEGKGEKLFLSHGLKVIISTFKWILYNCKLLFFLKRDTWIFLQPGFFKNSYVLTFYYCYKHRFPVYLFSVYHFYVLQWARCWALPTLFLLIRGYDIGKTRNLGR